MNLLTNETIDDMINDLVQRAAVAAFSDIGMEPAFELPFAWNVEAYMAEKETDIPIYITGIMGTPPYGGAANNLMERCKIAVRHGLGFSSDVDLEAYQNGTHEDRYHSLDTDISVPPNSDIGKAICITLLKDSMSQRLIYVLARSESVKLPNYLERFTKELDKLIPILGLRWSIGGALPSGYRCFDSDSYHVA